LRETPRINTATAIAQTRCRDRIFRQEPPVTHKSRILSAAAWLTLSAAALPATAWAQDQPAQNPGDQSAAKPQDQAPAAPKVLPATDPNLAVATVRLEGGYRASKVVGAAVYKQ
jgi:hypothetical protein